jgi:RNA polymerase subunit RPABC4/transcription elongation factor Spt4
VKKTLILLAVVMLIAIPSFSVFAQSVEDPAKPESIQKEITPPPEENTDIFTSLSKTFSAVGNILPLLLFCVLAITALWTFFDASRRTKYGWVWGVLALLFVPWIIYLIWRPQYTLEEKKILETDEELRRIQHDYYQFMLAREKQICSVCGTPLAHDFKICPNCYTEVKKNCAKCGKPLDLDWKVCPFCGNR